jgi:hypothetical protein
MKSLIFTALFIVTAVCTGYAQTQGAKYSVSGRIFDGMTSKPVTFALIVVKQAGVVTNSRQDGSFRVDLSPGSYTFIISSQGLQTLTTQVTVEGERIIDFTLIQVVKTGSEGITVRSEKDKQRISRQTMTVKEIRATPASFGDSVSALTSLPGINRVGGGLFGPLIIRGADLSLNGYFIDDIPLYKPMHFGGIHSVISSDLIESIDLYASAFPVQFENAQAAVININTVDNVKKAGGHSDIGLISANTYFETPVNREIFNDGNKSEENAGYIIAAGRYGYLTAFIPFIYNKILHQKLTYLPEYWDYQFKAKYILNRQHSITFITYGNSDMIKLNLRDIKLDPGADPLIAGLQFYNDDQSYTAGLYYKYTYSDQLENTLMSYSVYNRSRLWFNLPDATQTWAHDLGVNNDPAIYGIKDKLRMEFIKGIEEIRVGAGATVYDFRTSGKKIRSISYSNDLNQPGAVQTLDLDNRYINQTLTAYAENKLTVGWLTFVPGVHMEYFVRTHTGTVDPRGLISITFPSRTAIGYAGGQYSQFLQINPPYFGIFPELAGRNDLKPQRAWHNSVSIEQKADVYLFKAEGFYNTFHDIVESDVYLDGNGKPVGTYKNEGILHAYGIELLAKINEEKQQGLFGWVSYTYSRSKTMSRQSALFDPLYSNVWINSNWDIPHMFKLVTGYTFGANTISSKIQYNTPTPFTSITGSHPDDAYTAATGKVRIVPEYGKPNTGRLSADYRVDLRYSRQSNYQWGYFSWYIEVIGVPYLSSADKAYTWDYRYNYGSGNPKVVTSTTLFFLPSFGVEVKF